MAETNRATRSAVRRSMVRWGIPFALVLVGLTVFRAGGHHFIFSDSRFLRSVGRQAIRLQAATGGGDASSYFACFHAAVSLRDPEEARETMALVAAGVKGMSSAEQGKFANRVEEALLSSKSMSLTGWLVNYWSACLSVEFVHEGLLSPNVNAREGANCAAIAMLRRSSGRRADGIRALELTLDSVMEANEPELTANCLSLVVSEKLWPLLRSREVAVRGLLGSPDRRLREIAGSCLRRMRPSSRNREAIEGDTP